MNTDLIEGTFCECFITGYLSVINSNTNTLFMTTENILYTDGHEVTVTDSTFRVRKHSYRLEGISRHGFSIIKPSRVPAFILSGIGLLVLAMGISNLRPEINFTMSLFTYQVSLNTLLVVAGGSLIFIGSILIILMKERYGVRIVTAEGEKNVIVSDRREYVSMIVEALNKAFINTMNRSGKSEMGSSHLKMKVSSR
jgi:hypothetical protein